ncbi:MAG: hypothetical protein ACYC27_13305 [Armatimonadota bacterium]
MKAILKWLLPVIIALTVYTMPGYTVPDPGNPVFKGNRILAIDINEAETGGFNPAFDLARKLGAGDTGLSLDWSDLEPEELKYDAKWLYIANIYYPAAKMPISLTIRPISTNRKVVPTDLMNAAFDDPRMISRFKSLINFIFSQIPDVKLNSLVIGSEMDAYLGTDEIKWKQYQQFYKVISEYVRAKHPAVKIASEGTFDGLTGKAKSFMKVLNQNSDIIGVSYYPLNLDFSVKDPFVVGADMKSIVSLYPTKEIWFYQLGYPSSESLNSSESKQAAFIREVFTAWDKNASRVRMIDFTWMHDLPQSALDKHAEYYGLSDPKFLEFLRTLGFRTYQGAGKDKEAFKVLQTEARKRGWGK